MIERYQQAAVPAANFGGVMLERELMIMNPLERLKRDRSQRHDYFRIYQANRTLKKIRTVSDFTPGGPSISPRYRARITQGCAGDEDLRSV